MPQFPPVIQEAPKKGNPEDSIVLFGFGTLDNLVSSASVSANKLETYLRFQGLEYEAALALPSKSPTGKVPFVQHGPTVVADSHLIIKYLQNTYGDQLKFREPTEPEKVAVVIAVRRILENWLQDGIRWYRIFTNEGWSTTTDFAFNFLPSSVRSLVANRFRSKFAKNLKVVGVADHNEADLLRIFETDMDALAFFLGEKPFLTGDIPTEADATLFAVLDNIVNESFDTPLKAMVKARPNLASFVDRVTTQYYAEPSSFARTLVK